MEMLQKNDNAHPDIFQSGKNRDGQSYHQNQANPFRLAAAPGDEECKSERFTQWMVFLKRR